MKKNDYKKSGFRMSVPICVAFLIALDVILTRFLSIQTQFIRIGFGFIPVALAGIAFGPVYGALCGALGDILGMLIFPQGAFFPGFTLTALLTGAVYGWMCGAQPISGSGGLSAIVRLAAASSVVCVGLNLFLDTLWLQIMYGNGYIAVLIPRIVKCAVNIPIYTLILYVLWYKTLSRMITRLRTY